MISTGNDSFLVFGDVYRRDSIDATHYPAFHQMEGVRIYDIDYVSSKGTVEEAKEVCKEDLMKTLEGLATHVFGDVEMRWVDAYFPFTDPSIELEIFWNNDWLEILGCGVIHDQVMTNANRDISKQVGWAFGLGLDRWAMSLFGIPDIRLFWTKDPRFLDQFEPGKITKFQEYSKYPACYKDITFWVPEDYNENDFYQMIRNVAGDLVETVECIDEFTHPKTKRDSKCYRINYRHMDRSLTNEEVDVLQFKVRDEVESKLKCELR